MSLIAVVALFLCTYGLLHLYLLIKLRRAFYFEGLGYVFSFIVLLFLMIAPIHYRVLEAQEYYILSLLMAWIGNLWMGLLFIFVCLCIPLDVYHIVTASLQNLFDKDLTHLVLSRRQRFAIPAVLSVALLCYGVYEAHSIRTEIITLKSAKIPSETGRIRIVQISDLHLGPMTFAARLSPVIAAIKAASPDILVSTGDLVDGRLQDQASLAGRMAEIKAPLGKFAVRGNHEFYAGEDLADHIAEQCGFTLLNNKAATVAGAVSLVGVDDPAGSDFSRQKEESLLKKIPPQRYTVLLKHRPEVEPGNQSHFDLQLSGHAHGGQIFPFVFLVRWRYPLIDGLHNLSPAGHLYVSRGTGTWGPPVRILTPPEVTIIDLLPQKDGELPQASVPAKN